MNNQPHRGSMALSEIVMICLAILAGIVIIAMLWAGHPVAAFVIAIIAIVAMTYIHLQNAPAWHADSPPGKRRL